MSVRIERQRHDGSVIELAFTEHDDGDFHIDATPRQLNERRNAVMEGPWVAVRQVHGARVVDAAAVLREGLRADLAPEGDAVITDAPGVSISVQGADCAPLAFVTDSGPIAVAHAGWRGLAAGVIASVLETLSAQGAVTKEVIVGPLIGAECYEFGADDLDRVADVLGNDVRGVTAQGRPALDLKAAIVASCRLAGVPEVTFARPCTACGGGGFSHRARGDKQRHALVARIQP